MRQGVSLPAPRRCRAGSPACSGYRAPSYLRTCAPPLATRFACIIRWQRRPLACHVAGVKSAREFFSLRRQARIGVLNTNQPTGVLTPCPLRLTCSRIEHALTAPPPTANRLLTDYSLIRGVKRKCDEPARNRRPARNRQALSAVQKLTRRTDRQPHTRPHAPSHGAGTACDALTDPPVLCAARDV